MLNRKTLAQRHRWSPQVPGWGVFQVTDGALSWSDGLRVETLAPGEVVLVPSNAMGFQFEGRSGVAKLNYFLVFPDYLSGVLTWAERTRLRDVVAGKPAPVRQLDSSSDAAVELSRIGRGHPTGQGPLLRCELLRLFTSLFSDELATPGECATAWAPALERVRQLLRRLPEATLTSLTTSELARQCGCSRRHFNRLFRECCGVSVRSRQIELRLQKAGQLLRESNVKVIHVAMESGFRHLGLFNAMFKQRFGMTPGEWRHGRRSVNSK